MLRSCVLLLKVRRQPTTVGPRPHAVAHNGQYRKLVPGTIPRHKVKPGITGWAQVNGWRGETDTVKKMQKRVELLRRAVACPQNGSTFLNIKNPVSEAPPAS